MSTPADKLVKALEEIIAIRSGHNLLGIVDRLNKMAAVARTALAEYRAAPQPEEDLLPLDALLAGKEALLAISEDPTIKDAHDCWRAMEAHMPRRAPPQGCFSIDEAQYRLLLKLLDEAPAPSKELRELLSKKAPWEPSHD